MGHTLKAAVNRLINTFNNQRKTKRGLKILLEYSLKLSKCLIIKGAQQSYISDSKLRNQMVRLLEIGERLLACCDFAKGVIVWTNWVLRKSHQKAYFVSTRWHQIPSNLSVSAYVALLMAPVCDIHMNFRPSESPKGDDLHANWTGDNSRLAPTCPRSCDKCGKARYTTSL